MDKVIEAPERPAVLEDTQPSQDALLAAYARGVKLGFKRGLAAASKQGTAVLEEQPPHRRANQRIIPRLAGTPEEATLAFLRGRR